MCIIGSSLQSYQVCRQSVGHEIAVLIMRKTTANVVIVKIVTGVVQVSQILLALFGTHSTSVLLFSKPMFTVLLFYATRFFFVINMSNFVKFFEATIVQITHTVCT